MNHIREACGFKPFLQPASWFQAEGIGKVLRRHPQTLPAWSQFQTLKYINSIVMVNF